jgi:hypothetical protein
MCCNTTCRFPVIAKPNACGGSFSVLKATNIDELSAAVKSFYDGLPTYLESAGLTSQSACALGGMLVEEMIHGVEVSIHLMTQD